MSIYEEMIKAFSIFQKYAGDLDYVCAEHDVIYAGPEYNKVSEEDRAELEKLGWKKGIDGCGFQKFV